MGESDLLENYEIKNHYEYNIDLGKGSYPYKPIFHVSLNRTDGFFKIMLSNNQQYIVPK